MITSKQMCRAAQILGLALLSASTTAWSQAYPNRAVRLIVTFAAGGQADGLGRFLAQGLSERLGQQVIVENRPGGGGTLGAEAAARTAPDGYTIVLATAEAFGATPDAVKRLNYDPEKDLAPVAVVARAPNIISIHPSLKANTLREFIELARANPGKFRYGSVGIGTNVHITIETLKLRYNVDMIHVPYRGGGAGITDLVSGRIEMLMAGATAMAPRATAGQIRSLAVAGTRRSQLLPDVPTMAEAGFPEFDIAALYGVFAPAGTPTEIIARLASDIVATIQSAEFRRRLVDLGGEEVNPPLIGEAFGRLIRSDADRWRSMAIAAGIKEE